MGVLLKILETFAQMDKWLRHKFVRLVRIYFGNSYDPILEDISVLHLSPSFLVINKRHDVIINDNGSHHKITVQKQLCHLFPHLVDSSLQHQFRFPHRLDYSTSGVLCVALNKKAANLASEAFSNRATQKYYLALLRGHTKENYLMIDLGIGKDKRSGFSHRMCASSRSFCDDARRAFTQLIVLQRGRYENEPVTKVLLKLITGRRHQLRVHCMEIGHTIVGDYTYSDRKDVFPSRMFLHSFRLVLPTKLETIDVTTPDPFSALQCDKWTPVDTIHAIDERLFEIFCDYTKFTIWIRKD